MIESSCDAMNHRMKLLFFGAFVDTDLVLQRIDIYVHKKC